MRQLLKRLAIAFLLLLVAGIALILLATDERALVDRGEAISPDSVAQAKRLLANNDPRRQQAGEIRTVTIPAALIDEATNYVASRYLHGRGSFSQTESNGDIWISVAVPGKRFLNLRTRIQAIDGLPKITQAQLGSLELPTTLVEFVIARMVATYGYDKEWQLAAKAIQKIAFEPNAGTISVTYIWEPMILDRARAVAMQEDDVKRLHTAQTSLAALVAHRATGSRITLAEILEAIIPVTGGDTFKQGRAGLLVLASLMAGKDLAALVPAAKGWPRVRWVHVTLAGRHDLAQHFLISATLAAWAGEPVADAIGLYKELEDARHGSGFSFIDLAADRAGTRFGTILIKDPERLIDTMKNNFGDDQLLPPVADLPEFLHQREFERQFENRESTAFQAMQVEIEHRLDTLSLYR